jgi:hypothetical protein
MVKENFLIVFSAFSTRFLKKAKFDQKNLSLQLSFPMTEVFSLSIMSISASISS